MTEVKYLSYILEKNIPVYGNKSVSLPVKSEKSIAKGDSCNKYRFSMGNHWGTHIDAPAHFFKAAKKMADYHAKNWVFNNPCVLDLNLKGRKVIELNKINNKVGKDRDLLLLKTGFGRFRGLSAYSFNNPAVSPGVGSWLRRERPNIRAIGFDFVSIGSPDNKVLARESHRAFLDPKREGKPINIIEDMDLSCDLSGLKMVIAAPLLIGALDSAPCTVLGIFNKKSRRRNM